MTPFVRTGLELRKSPGKGRGVFTRYAINPGELIELCPVLVIVSGSARLGGDLKLIDYVWAWGEYSALAMGISSFFNHSDKPNVSHRRNVKAGTIAFTAIRSITEGEELFIDYKAGAERFAYT